MKRIAFNFAASSLVLGVTTVGCMMNGVGTGPASAAQPHSRSDQQATRFYEQAGRAIAAGNIDEARTALEQAVALAPRDAGYRLLLADAYMKSGRFQSAEATYRDVLALDPGRTRAALSLALMQVANGRQQDAMAQLERIEGEASPADLGLAYALAGAPQRAVEILEPAARGMGATARIRQNLALAYAFGGDWQRARTIAAQDVSPSELGARMTSWASLTQRSNSPEQVAAMLGVNPVRDPGQPIQLALARPARAPAVIESRPAVGYAAAEPTLLPVAAPVVTAEVQVVADRGALPLPPPVAHASAEPIGDPVPVPVPAPVAVPASVGEAPSNAHAELDQPEWGIDQSGEVALPSEEPADEQAPARVQYAAAAAALVRPDPVVMPVANRAVRSIAPIAARVIRAGSPVSRRSATGRYVVQIGAFSSSASAERAWQLAERRFGLRAEQPVTMTIDLDGRLLHRVAVSGFDKRGDARQVCNAIRARGGECFVRNSAGDAANSWAARYARRA